MGGLRKLCKMYGRMKLSSHGKTLTYVWDYDQEVAVLESEIPVGSERWKQSERARAKLLESLKKDEWSMGDK